jgi:hypothetical protein
MWYEMSDIERRDFAKFVGKLLQYAEKNNIKE